VSLDKLFATTNDLGNGENLGEQMKEEIQAIKNRTEVIRKENEEIQKQLDQLSLKAGLCQGRKCEIAHGNEIHCPVQFKLHLGVRFVY